jgi:hypothetical protein
MCFQNERLKMCVTAQVPSPSRGGKEGMGLVAPVVFSKACSVGPSPPSLPLKGRGISAPCPYGIYANDSIGNPCLFIKYFKIRSPIKHFGDDILGGLGMTKASCYLVSW